MLLRKFFSVYSGFVPPSARPFVPPPAPEHKLIPSGMPQEVKPRKVVGSRIVRSIPAFEDSVMYKEQHMFMDAGLFQGRSFRVGWGPGHTLLHGGTPLHKQQSEGMLSSIFSSISSGHKCQPLCVCIDKRLNYFRGLNCIHCLKRLHPYTLLC